MAESISDSPEVVDGAMQRQSIALRARLLRRDLCRRAAQEGVVVSQGAPGSEPVDLEWQGIRDQRRLPVDDHEVQMGGVSVAGVAQLADDLSLANLIAWLDQDALGPLLQVGVISVAPLADIDHHVVAAEVVQGQTAREAAGVCSGSVSRVPTTRPAATERIFAP
jgi:hypothetical protein